MSEKFEKPKFGLLEQIAAFYRVATRTSLGYQLMRLIHGQAWTIRNDVHRALLEKRLPWRNSDGNMNWANIFAVSMQLAHPIRRSDVFQEGTEGMSREDIIGKACEFVARCSTRRNYAPVTTAWDPVEFPEVVDPEFHDVAAKINGTDFARTIDSWAGHAYRANGFLASGMTIMVDTRNFKGEKFREAVSGIMDQWNGKERIKVYSVGGDRPDDLFQGRLGLEITPPADWQKNELPPAVLSPTQYLLQRVPNYYRPDGYVDEQVYALSETQKALKETDAYAINYFRRKNTYAHSDACRKLHDEFWMKIGHAAEDINKTSTPSE